MKTPWLIIGLLLTTSAAAAQAPSPDGKALYDKNCRMCHGADGIPSPAMVSGATPSSSADRTTSWINPASRSSAGSSNLHMMGTL